MNYVREESKVIYKSKGGRDSREFDSLDFIASLASHIPNMGEQTVRYLGFYINVCRGRRKRQNSDGADFIITDDEYTKGCNKSWARLIKKIYEVDPLICPKCGRLMRIIAFIEDYKVMRNILDYLGIYEFKRDRPPPRVLAVVDNFDDWRCDDYVNTDYMDF
ncbi:MAG: transposase [Candidatus Hydromicrobium sp.]